MEYDIAIIGGGMVGAALACGLANSSLRVALVDANATHLADDPRLIALNYKNAALLKSLNLEDKLSHYATAIHQVHVSHRGHFGITRLNAHDLKLPELGFVIPAKYINLALYERLNELTQITCIRPAKLISLQQHVDVNTLTVETDHGHKTLTAKIVIAADGTHSTVRDLLHIPTDTFDYHQKALVTVTQLQRSHHHVAYERFHATGAIAMLPLRDNQVATILTDTEKNIDALMQLSDTDFLAYLQNQFGYRLGRLSTTLKRHTFPLKLTKALHQRQQNILLIGNAAHTLHPIAAQGLNLAFYEVATLCEFFANQTSQTLSLRDLPSLVPKQNASQTLSHRLSSIFANDFFILGKARQLGMVGLDIFPAIKRGLARYI